MTRTVQLLLLGFIFVVAGITLLVIGLGTGNGFFVVFPFVFASGMSPLFALAGVVVFVLFLYFMMKPALDFFQEDSGLSRVDSGERYVRISNVCSYCGGAIPERGVYCPSCGTPLDDGFNQ